jgi:hypothetical protein
MVSSTSSARARVASSEPVLSMTKSARRTFSSSESWAAMRAFASSSVLPSRRLARSTWTVSGTATTTTGDSARSSPTSNSNGTS